MTTTATQPTTLTTNDALVSFRLSEVLVEAGWNRIERNLEATREAIERLDQANAEQDANLNDVPDFSFGLEEELEQEEYPQDEVMCYVCKGAGCHCCGQ